MVPAGRAGAEFVDDGVETDVAEEVADPVGDAVVVRATGETVLVGASEGGCVGAAEGCAD